MPVTSASNERGTRALRFAFPFGDSQNFSSVDSHNASIQRHDRLRVGVVESTQAKTAQASAGSADAGFLGVIAELRDAAYNDGVHAQQFADFGGGVRVGAITVGEILLRQYLVHGLALEYRVAAVLDQVLDEQIRDSLADVDVLPEDRGYTAVHGGVVKVEDGDALLARCGCGLPHHRRNPGRGH